MYEPVLQSTLPRGRHNLSRGSIEADQRRRLLAAMPIALAEHGYARATVAHVLELAGVSRRTFYEQFDGKEECLLAAYDDAEQRLWERAAAAAAAAAPDWSRQVHAALGAVLAFAAAEPAAARLFTLEARAAGPPIADRHRRALDRLASILRTHSLGLSGAVALPGETERTLLANVAAVLGAHIIAGSAEALPALEPQLADYLLAPYREEGTAVRRISSAAARGPR